jgi:hypothetical protein
MPKHLSDLLSVSNRIPSPVKDISTLQLVEVSTCSVLLSDYQGRLNNQCISVRN